MRFKHGKRFKILDKKSVFIDNTVTIGQNVTIYENNRICGETCIGDNVTIMPGCYIKNCKVANNTLLDSSHAEDSVIGENCNIGPFARLRPNTELKNDVKIGNFVEVKNSVVGEGTKINHLAYVGDANVGKGCNIGCGAIFVNYNGRKKNRSIIGDKCFIGSNCNIIAPVNIASNAYICAGTTVTDDVNTDDFVIGRVRQQIKTNKAHLYLKESKGE